MSQPFRFGVLVSGGGTNLQSIINACNEGRLDARLAFVGSDSPVAGGLQRAASHGIPKVVVDYKSVISDASRLRAPKDFHLEEIRRKIRIFPDDADPRRVHRFLTSRAVAESMLLEGIRPFEVDLLVLAGFMRVLTPYFIDRFSPDPMHPRILNIHPALLPAFPGTDGYGDTFHYGCKVGGCTVHFVDYGEDTGPIVGQRCFSIGPEDTLESVRQKGLSLEWELYPECIRMTAENRLRCVRTDAGRTVVEILPS